MQRDFIIKDNSHWFHSKPRLSFTDNIHEIVKGIILKNFAIQSKSSNSWLQIITVRVKFMTR